MKRLIGILNFQFYGTEYIATLDEDGIWRCDKLHSIANALNSRFSLMAMPTGPALGEPGYANVGAAEHYLSRYGLVYQELIRPRETTWEGSIH